MLWLGVFFVVLLLVLAFSLCYVSSRADVVEISDGEQVGISYPYHRPETDDSSWDREADLRIKWEEFPEEEE